LAHVLLLSRKRRDRFCYVGSSRLFATNILFATNFTATFAFSAPALRKLAWRWGIRAGILRANVEGEEIVLGGDIILRVNEVSVEQNASYDEIYGSIARLKPGDNFVITVFRQGQSVKLSIPIPQ
jgi:hypothetical protein